MQNEYGLVDKVKDIGVDIGYFVGAAALSTAITGIALPMMAVRAIRERIPRETPLIGNPSLKFVEKQLKKNSEAKSKIFKTNSTFPSIPNLKISPGDSADVDNNRAQLLRTGIILAETQGKHDIVMDYVTQLEELKKMGLQNGRWNNEGYVTLDLHNHFRTSDRMEDVLGQVLAKVTRSQQSPAIIGVVDFENYGARSRFTQLEKQSEDHRYVGNALYFPIQDVMFVKGQEVPTQQGHLLVMGLARNQFLKSGMSLEDTLKQAKDYNAMTIVDHPFSPHGGLGPFLMQNQDYLNMIDAWEIHNAEAAVFRGANKKAAEVFDNYLAENYPIAPISGSDGHSIYEIGRASTEIDMPAYKTISSNSDLMKAIKTGLKSNKRYMHKTGNSIIGAVDHMLDLATIVGLSKFGIKI